MDTLGGLKPKKSAVVIKISDENFAHKAALMGIVPGTVIFMLENTPLKKHLKIALRGYSVRVSKKDAAKIEILKTSTKHLR